MRLPVSPEILERVERLDVSFNRHGFDPFGVSKRSVAEMFTVFAWMYRKYFDVHVVGLEHVPPEGRAMVVGNHSGGWALDGMMALTAIFLEKDPPRLGHSMAEKFMSKMPVIGLYAQRTGNFTGVPENAIRLLKDDRLLMVYPEGARGTEKLYPERNSLVEFGSGFLRLALRAQAPLIPMAFIGGGDAVPTIFNIYRGARRLGIPYIPVTPWGVPLPRPATLQIYFGEPMYIDGDGNEEDVVIHRWVDEVKARIRELIERGLKERPLLDNHRRPFRAIGAGG